MLTSAKSETKKFETDDVDFKQGLLGFGKIEAYTCNKTYQKGCVLKTNVNEVLFWRSLNQSSQCRSILS